MIKRSTKTINGKTVETAELFGVMKLNSDKPLTPRTKTFFILNDIPLKKNGFPDLSKKIPSEADVRDFMRNKKRYLEDKDLPKEKKKKYLNEFQDASQRNVKDKLVNLEKIVKNKRNDFVKRKPDIEKKYLPQINIEYIPNNNLNFTNILKGNLPLISNDPFVDSGLVGPNEFIFSKKTTKDTLDSLQKERDNIVLQMKTEQEKNGTNTNLYNKLRRLKCDKEDKIRKFRLLPNLKKRRDLFIKKLKEEATQNGNKTNRYKNLEKDKQNIEDEIRQTKKHFK